MSIKELQVVKDFAYTKRDLLPVMACPMPTESANNLTPRDINLYENIFNVAPKSIYVHIPFCSHICSFCPYVKYQYDEEKILDYVKYLEVEIERYASTPYLKNSVFGSVYFGGGTASSPSDKVLINILEKIRKSFNFDENAEFTIEANPTTVNFLKLKNLYQAGFNRVSFGVQTFNKHLGEKIGVDPTPEQSVLAIQNAYNSGFRNISIDLICNIPGQNLKDFIQDINSAEKYMVNQISVFPLAIVPKTPLFKLAQTQGIFGEKDINEEFKFYCESVNYLEGKGFKQVNSNDFRRSDHTFRHEEIRYTFFGDLLGLGVGAMGSINSYNYVNVGELQRYKEILSNVNVLPFNAIVKKKKDDLPYQLMSMGLRQLSVSITKFKDFVGKEPSFYFHDILCNLLQKNLINLNKDKIELTLEGKFFSYNIAKEFFPSNAKDGARKSAHSLARKSDLKKEKIA